MQDLLVAARALLDARDSQMITRVEWETLERAVADAMRPLEEAKIYEGFLEVWSDACLGAAFSGRPPQLRSLMCRAPGALDDQYRLLLASTVGRMPTSAGPSPTTAFSKSAPTTS